jgi:hypothetical protein
MKKGKKVIYKVRCSFNSKHFFHKAFTVEEGTEHTETKAEAYCPFCDKWVSVTIQGKLIPDKELIRKFGLPDSS